jgi:NAD(P)-dependent dehydrogenase (short-subunit alcohol dehydrogenase family)
MKLQDRVTLVIGGASGIGRATAEVCAAEGARVMIADVNEGGAKAVAAGIGAQGGSVAVVTCDITAEDSVRGAVDATVSEFACKYSLERMERDGGGAIVNISSLAGVTGSIAGSIDETGYPCAKHGVIGLTRTLALAYAQKNIRVNAVCPGYIRTALTRPLYETEDGGRSLITEQLRVPMGRWGEATEIATVAAFLLSDEASYITGQPIIVDGGFMAR